MHFNCRSQTTNKKPYMAAINALLLATGICRAFVLFIDPYNTRRVSPISIIIYHVHIIIISTYLICIIFQNISSVVTHLTWDLGLCSLVTALSLLQLTYLQLTQVSSNVIFIVKN